MTASSLQVQVEAQAPNISAKPNAGWWLFSAPVDLSVFLGSAVVSLLALWLGAQAGVLNRDAPDWAWIPAVLLIDVAHVYSTGFRVYLDTGELKRRPLLYALVPAAGFAASVFLYSRGELVFWRALAYLAVFHFVRQQYGWVVLYRARVGERGKLGWMIDSAAVYMATIYPLIYWHAHLPRRFWWFLANDFTGIPEVAAAIAKPLYWTAMILYAGRSIFAWALNKDKNPGKDIVVITTAVCWYVGIIGCNSDYAFTVTNVIIHGVPYLALVYWYARSQRPRAARPYRFLSHDPFLFLGLLWILAYAEEMFWDRGVWHDRSWFFGSGWEVGSLKLVLVPLLALPQLVHYVLDGFVWRRKSNPDFHLV